MLSLKSYLGNHEYIEDAQQLVHRAAFFATKYISYEKPFRVQRMFGGLLWEKVT